MIGRHPYGFAVVTVALTTVLISFGTVAGKNPESRDRHPAEGGLNRSPFKAAHRLLVEAEEEEAKGGAKATGNSGVDDETVEFGGCLIYPGREIASQPAIGGSVVLKRTMGVKGKKERTENALFGPSSTVVRLSNDKFCMVTRDEQPVTVKVYHGKDGARFVGCDGKKLSASKENFFECPTGPQSAVALTSQYLRAALGGKKKKSEIMCAMDQLVASAWHHLNLYNHIAETWMDRTAANPIRERLVVCKLGQGSGEEFSRQPNQPTSGQMRVVLMHENYDMVASMSHMERVGDPELTVGLFDFRKYIGKVFPKGLAEDAGMVSLGARSNGDDGDQWRLKDSGDDAGAPVIHATLEHATFAHELSHYYAGCLMREGIRSIKAVDQYYRSRLGGNMNSNDKRDTGDYISENLEGMADTMALLMIVFETHAETDIEVFVVGGTFIPPNGLRRYNIGGLPHPKGGGEGEADKFVGFEMLPQRRKFFDETTNGAGRPQHSAWMKPHYATGMLFALPLMRTVVGTVDAIATKPEQKQNGKLFLQVSLAAASELVGTSVLGAEAGWLVQLATQMEGSKVRSNEFLHGGLSRPYPDGREQDLMKRVLDILGEEDKSDVALRFDELAHPNLVFRNCFLRALHDEATASATFSRHADRVVQAAWDAFASVGMGPAAMAGHIVIIDSTNANGVPNGNEQVIQPFIHIGDYCSRGWATEKEGCDGKLVFRDGWHLDAVEEVMPLKRLGRDAANVAAYMDSVAQMCEKGLSDLRGIDPVDVSLNG